jgi:hypothetical protein
MIRQVVGDILLLDNESGQVHQLNETAGFIWRTCEDVPSVDGIAELLAKEFDVRHDIALKDVAETLSKLRALNLVVET